MATMMFSTPSLWWTAPTKVQVQQPEPTTSIISRQLPQPTKVEAGVSSDIADQADTHRGLNLLNLPLEIRLQIYHWLLLLHPLKHAKLAPWYPTPTYSAYYVGLVKPYSPPGEEEKEKTPESARDVYKPKLLCPDRPICGLPTALLRANRQIYGEAREIPFVENEFVFVNWFSSGLWAARAFTRPLAQWQKDATRYVRVELLARDFTGAGLKEWVALCEAWAPSLRGLRLKILIGGGIVEPAVSFAELKDTAEGEAMNLFCDPEPRPAWIREGLEKLQSVETIEVELASLDWDANKKLQWCASLESMLAADERCREKKVRVACVAKLLPTAAKDKIGGAAHSSKALEAGEV